MERRPREPRFQAPSLALFSFLAGSSLWLPACSRASKDTAPAPPSVQEAPQPNTPDRLPPGRLLEGTEEAFGLVLPRKLTVQARFPEEVQAAGEVNSGDLIDFVKDRVLSDHVEMAGDHVVFPKVSVKAAEGRVVRVEIFGKGQKTWLRIRDLTPPKAAEGLTEEERWKRAGLTPKGQLVDPSQME